MSITKKEIQKALYIRKCVKTFFETSSTKRIEAKELMPLLVNNGIFPAQYSDGLPLRNFLRRLEEEKMLRLIPEAHYEQKEKNMNWFFISG